MFTVVSVPMITKTSSSRKQNPFNGRVLERRQKTYMQAHKYTYSPWGKKRNKYTQVAHRYSVHYRGHCVAYHHSVYNTSLQYEYQTVITDAQKLQCPDTHPPVLYKDKCQSCYKQYGQQTSEKLNSCYQQYPLLSHYSAQEEFDGMRRSGLPRSGSGLPRSGLPWRWYESVLD